MNIAVAFKVVPDDQDIRINSDRTLDDSKAHRVVSTYDLNAIEAAAQLAAAEEGSRLVAITVGDATINDSKLKKNVLARGVDELFMTSDDAAADLDAYATAGELAALLNKTGDYDVVICGDGSADLYARQVDVQLASRLGVPCVTGVTKLTKNGSTLLVERLLENELEVVEVPLPAVVSVSPDAALPRICGMKDILAAGKKPTNMSDSEGGTKVLEVLEEVAPEQAQRSLRVFDASADGDLEGFIAAVKEVL